jgi:hypothetical protein
MLATTMTTDNVFFANHYGGIGIDFFFNIENVEIDNEEQIWAIAKSIKALLEKAYTLAVNSCSVVSLSFEVSDNIQNSTYQYLSYLPQFFEDLGIPIIQSSTFLGDRLLLSILPCATFTKEEINSTLLSFLSLPHLDKFPLERGNNEALDDLVIVVERFKKQLLKNEFQNKRLECEISELKDAIERPVNDDSISFFGGCLKISTIKFYGLEIDIAKILKKLSRK